MTTPSVRSPPSPTTDQALVAEILKNDLLLHEAVIKNDSDEVSRILKEPCDVNSRNNYGRAPIHWAASRGNVVLIKILMKAKCDIEARDKYGMRPLLMTAWHGHLEAMVVLLDAGACINSVNKLQQTLLMCAARNKQSQLEIVEHILKVLSSRESSCYSRSKGHRRDSAGHLAPGEHGGKDIIPGLNMKDAEGHTALHHAAIVGHETIVQRLATAGAEINPSDNLSRTPLHSACFGGHLETAICLLECGAIPGAQDSSGDTPLHAATSAQHKEVVAKLLDCESEPDCQNDKGWTPLHIASSLGCRGIIDTLLQSGADINKQDNSGNTPLHIACQAGNIDTVELFVSKGADLNSLNVKNETPMHVAATRSDAAICRALLAAGASSELVTKAISSATATPHPKGSPFMAAARGSFTAIVDMIIKTAKLDCPSDNEETLGSGSAVKPIADMPKRNWRNSQEDLSQLSDEEQMKEVLWRLAYRQLLAGEWRKLAFHWDFSEEQVKAIEHQYSGPSSYKEHGYRMLLLWQRDLSSGTNQLNALCEGLVSIGKKGIAEVLKKMQENRDQVRSSGKCNCINCSIT